jgi:oxepin-CoA hydrolase/3-oxo-5,6-dehydrosuberyl-CoA semialdehyde dehydrogenase
MDTAKLAFIQNGLVPLLQQLKSSDTGKWGKMNAQQMVEHVAGFFKVSTEKIKFPLVTPEAHLPKYKEFLLSDKAFRENTQAPVNIVPEEPVSVEHAHLQEALVHLQQEINDFILFFEKDPAVKTTHPVFGPLDFEEWILLHYKHAQHHLKQFGLTERL